MSLTIFALVLIFFIFINFFMYRDLASPAFLMLIPWLISVLLLFGSELYYEIFSWSYLYIIIGLFVFQVFYYLAFISGRDRIYYSEQREKYVKINSDQKVNFIAVFVIVIFETVTMMYYLMITNKNSDSIGGIFEYIHKMIFAIFYLLLIHFFSSDDIEKKKTIKLLFLQIFPVAIALMLKSNGRASYFSFLFSVLFIYLTYHSESIKQIINVFFVGLIVLVFLFIYVALRKKQIISGGMFSDLLVQVRNWVTHYASSPIVTFSKWLPNYNVDFDFGKNTFRIFKAIAHKIGVPVDVPSTIFPFMRVSPGVNGISNVYTIYYTYIIDFGLLGGVVVQGFLGFLYAKVYKMKDTYKTGMVYLYSVLMYALLMEVFGDQYVATMSSYFQMYLWYFLFYKCQLLYTSNIRRIRVVKE